MFRQPNNKPISGRAQRCSSNNYTNAYSPHQEPQQQASHKRKRGSQGVEPERRTKKQRFDSSQQRPSHKRKRQDADTGNSRALKRQNMSYGNFNAKLIFDSRKTIKQILESPTFIELECAVGVANKVYHGNVFYILLHASTYLNKAHGNNKLQLDSSTQNRLRQFTTNLYHCFKRYVESEMLDKNAWDKQLGCISSFGYLAKLKLVDFIALDWFVAKLGEAQIIQAMSSNTLANFVYGLGLLAKEEKLAVSTSLSEVLAACLDYLVAADKLKNLEAKKIANVLYSIGLIAKAGNLAVTLAGDAISELLKSLMSMAELNAQAIANTLYGLGLLAGADKLAGTLAGDTINELLTSLKSMADLDSQKIANTLYGLGLLAKAGNLAGTLAGDTISELLKRLKSIAGTKPQEIANTLYGLGLLAGADKLAGTLVGDAINELLKSLTSMADLDSQKIANTLYGLGLLAKADKLAGTLAGDTINELLKSLKSMADLDAQAIANTLYGLGLLAKADKLAGTLAMDTINELLKSLKSMVDLDSQAIANILYGLGLLAKADKLAGTLAGDTINELLKSLKSMADLDAQEIANTLYGLGLLAKVGNLAGTLAGDTISELLKRLKSIAGTKPQEIANTLYGLGLLAGADKLAGTLAGDTINELLKSLTSMADLDSQEIANILYGLGLLAKADKLAGTLAMDTINELLKSLKSMVDLDSQKIANTLYGLGLLAKADKLAGTLAGDTINELLKSLTSMADLNPQEIANTLYGLGLLAKAGNLAGTLAGDTISDLLKSLTSMADLNPQEIANTLYGLGLLAGADKLAGTLAGNTINELLKSLKSMADLDSQEIANTLYGLGLLAKAGNLAGTLAGDTISELLKSLTYMAALEPQHIANTLYGLGLVVKAGWLDCAQLGELIAELLAKILQGCEPINQRAHIFQLLDCMAPLDRYFDKVFPELVTKLCHFYVPLPTIARLLITVANSDTLRSMIEQLLPLIQDERSMLPLLADELRASLRESLNKLPADNRVKQWFDGAAFVPTEHPALPADLAEVPEVPIPPHRRQRASSSSTASPTLFSGSAVRQPKRKVPASSPVKLKPKVIASQWSEALKELIAKLTAQGRVVATGSRPAHGHSGSSGQGASGGLSRLFSHATQAGNNPAQLVLDFLDKAPAKALQALAADEPSADNFNLLIQQLGQHQFYQSLRTAQCTPILLGLPLAALKDFCKFLQSPKMVYRDHRALLEVINALLIRETKSVSTQDKEFCHTLQKTLLKKAIDWHRDKHRHVVSKLEDKLAAIKARKSRLSELDIAASHECDAPELEIHIVDSALVPSANRTGFFAPRPACLPDTQVWYDELAIYKVWETYIKAGNIDFITFGEGDRAHKPTVEKHLFTGDSMQLPPRKDAALLAVQGKFYIKEGMLFALCGAVKSTSADTGTFNTCSQAFNNAIRLIKTYKERYDARNLIEQVRLIFPYHLNGNHWTLGVVELALSKNKLRRAQVTILDSLSTTGSTCLTTVTRAAMAADLQQVWPHDEVRLGELTGIHAHYYAAHQASPQQVDGSSCGVITAENGKALLHRTVKAALLEKKYASGALNLRQQHKTEIIAQSPTALVNFERYLQRPVATIRSYQPPENIQTLRTELRRFMDEEPELEQEITALHTIVANPARSSLEVVEFAKMIALLESAGNFNGSALSQVLFKRSGRGDEVEYTDDAINILNDLIRSVVSEDHHLPARCAL